MRIEILKVLTQNMPISDFDFEDIAQKTHLCSGADLENLCREVKKKKVVTATQVPRV